MPDDNFLEGIRNLWRLTEYEKLEKFVLQQTARSLRQLALEVAKLEKPVHNLDIRLAWMDVNDEETVEQHVTTHVEAYQGADGWFVEESNIKTVTGQPERMFPRTDGPLPEIE